MEIFRIDIVLKKMKTSTFNYLHKRLSWGDGVDVGVAALEREEEEAGANLLEEAVGGEGEL